MMPKNLSLIQEADENTENISESLINKSQLQLIYEQVLGSNFDPSKLSPRAQNGFGFDLSYEMSPTREGNLPRMTSMNKMNDSWAVNNISRITGVKLETSTSNFIDDSKMMEALL